MDSRKQDEGPKKNRDLAAVSTSRRGFLKGLSLVAAAGSAGLVSAGCAGGGLISEETGLRWEEYFKSNYRLMTQEEKDATVARLVRLAKLQRDLNIQMSSQGPRQEVLFGYAFNISRCKGYMDCVKACVRENNLDRRGKTQYIRIFELDHGKLDPTAGDGRFYHEVPAEGKFYMGVQCYHCENAPCIKACPTGSRVFGNLLDPDSEIRYVLKNKKVFRFKEDLQTDPKFWYFMD